MPFFDESRYLPYDEANPEKEEVRREIQTLTLDYLLRGGRITKCPTKKPRKIGPAGRIKAKFENTTGQRVARKTVIDGAQEYKAETYAEFKRYHLTDEENKVLWLKDRQRKTFKEIAITIKKKTPTVRKIAARAREKAERGILSVTDGRKKQRNLILRKKAK